MGGGIENSEFKIYSQNGEDGIIDFLLQALDLSDYPKAFVEFGVENYKEANTRFLLQFRNFQGLVIDGSTENINYIKSDSIYWKYDLEAKCAFITKDNINDLIYSWLESRNLSNILLLSIDIDGNDFYIFDSITCVNPAIVIIEYNPIFGYKESVSVPYRDDFNRFKAHYSGLYFGASIKALVFLGKKKGYNFIGADSSGTNLFFVKDCFNVDFIKTYPLSEYCNRHHVRQSRSRHGNLNYLAGNARNKEIEDLPLINPFS